MSLLNINFDENWLNNIHNLLNIKFVNTHQNLGGLISLYKI